MTSPDLPALPRPCVLTGEPGENPDDCTTHGHEPDMRLAEIGVRAATFTTVTVSFPELAAAWRRDEGIPDGSGEEPEDFQLIDRDWVCGGRIDGLLSPLLGYTGDADLIIDSFTVITDPAPERIAGAQAAKTRAENPGPDACADAMTALHDRILSLVPAGQREDAEGLLADLMDLTGENLSGAARDEVIRQALAGAPADAGSGDARALRVAAEILHDRGAPGQAVNLVSMYAGLADTTARDNEHVYRIGRFTDADRRPVEIGVDHDLMTFAISGVGARLNREQQFRLHALKVAATVAIDTYNAARENPDD